MLNQLGLIAAPIDATTKMLNAAGLSGIDEALLSLRGVKQRGNLTFAYIFLMRFSQALKSS